MAQRFGGRKRVKKGFAPNGGTTIGTGLLKGTGTASSGGTFTPADYGTLPDTSYKDSNYYGTDSQITQGLNNLKPYLINQAGGLAADYGVDGTGFDPTTYDPANPQKFGVDWANVDTTNPFSRAALLKKSYQQQSRGDGNRMAAAGQLYSGAYQNAQNNDTSNYTQGQNSLVSDFAQKYGGLYGQWQTANSDATNARIANTGNAINAHANDPAAAPVKTFSASGNAKFGKALKHSPLYAAWRNRGNGGR